MATEHAPPFLKSISGVNSGSEEEVREFLLKLIFAFLSSFFFLFLSPLRFLNRRHLRFNPPPHTQQMYKYRYPFIGSKAQRVPAAALPLLALAFPSLVIVAHALLAGPAAALLGSHHPPPSRLEAHAALLGLFASVVSTGAATNLLKIGVGRPRPNFGKLFIEFVFSFFSSIFFH